MASISAWAVIASLVYVATQIRQSREQMSQNTRALQAGAYQQFEPGVYTRMVAALAIPGLDRVSAGEVADRMMEAVRRREVDVVVCVKLDRLARSLRHLTEMAAELEACGVALLVIDQAIDTSTPAGPNGVNSSSGSGGRETWMCARACAREG